MDDERTDGAGDESTAARTSELRHELANRLAAIVAFSHLIRTDPRLPDDLRDQAALLVEEADRTRSLVDRILGAAQSGRSEIDRGPGGDSRPLTTGARVLVVEDEEAIREYLGRILRGLGYRPLLVGDGQAALAIVATDPPDAILCDHRMAGLSGTAFNDAVAGTRPDLARRFALMSGDVSNSDLRAAADARGIGLLAKPFDSQTVARTIEEILRA